ncbi:MAG: hypothetical protein ACERKK_01670 [Poseidonibacter sp.]|uniref:hypothetical protein n=1 Tax=Poseidonibacter sp. TaxID=2321188 RepID=UPI00359D9B4E
MKNLQLENKNIYFTGRGNRIEKEELEKYLIQKGANLATSLNEASIIIQGKYTPIHLEEEIYLLSKNGVDIISIDNLEEEFSLNLDINSILMAIKISKDNDRLIKLLGNDFFCDDVFIKLLKLYDFKNDDIYDSDDNRDVCTKIVERFCSLIQTNHNIQYAPIGVYYTALEATNPKLLEIIYNMPEYKISQKNAQEDQPISLKEVVALNPNSSKTTHIQILKNSKENELKFLALNESISLSIAKKLFEKNIEEINISLIKAMNYDDTLISEFLKDNRLKKELLKTIVLDDELFRNLFVNLDEVNTIYLSSNISLDTNMIDKIFEKNIDNANINLLKNKNCSKEKINDFIKQNDKIYNISIAHNINLEESIYEYLFELNDYDVHLSLANNIACKKSVLSELSLLNDKYINEALCANISTPINILLQYQYDGGLKNIISNNDSFREFTRKMVGM